MAPFGDGDIMKADRLHHLIQYVLAVAAHGDDRRELGVIHILKYVYLADLSYAAVHGLTFTEAQWRFHKFGPWSGEAWKAIEPVLVEVGAHKRSFSSVAFEGEGVRWRLGGDADEIAFAMEKKLPWELIRAVRRFVRKFEDDTSELLHYVYGTQPMLEAKPGDVLVFRASEQPHAYDAETPEERTEKQKKKLRALRESVREALKERMKHRKKPLVPPDPPPRYDETYEEGRRMMDDAAGNGLSPERGEMTFSDEVWKSRGRHDSGSS